MQDLICAEKEGISRTIRVLGLIEQRVGAKVVGEFVEDLTPATEYEKPRERVLEPLFHRPRGTGRPTKKQRRAMGTVRENL